MFFFGLFGFFFLFYSPTNLTSPSSQSPSPSGKTVEGYWDSQWEKLQLNYLVALFEVLRGIPASSSDVERRFADQSKIHVKSRKCLKEETVSVLMNLRAAQKAVLRKRGWAAVPTDEFNSDVLERILALEVQGQIEHDAKGLKVGDQVVVHFGLGKEQSIPATVNLRGDGWGFIVLTLPARSDDM